MINVAEACIVTKWRQSSQGRNQNRQVVFLEVRGLGEGTARVCCFLLYFMSVDS